MKKITLILLAAVVLFGASCAPRETFELALVTDRGTIDDRSFNQASWEGLVRFAQANNISHRYFQPAEHSNAAILTAIDLAIRAGARLVVTPGFLFEVPIFYAQDRYPDVKFILVDGSPNDGDWSREGGPVFRTNDNVVGIHYAEDQAGFLAGYAAVKDGFRNLGFIGGMAVPPVVRFGFGFIMGVEYAARDLGLEPGSISIRYHYTGHFNPAPEVQTLAASWYNAGVEVIFAAAGGAGNSVMAAAEQAGAFVIGVDVDQSGESHSVITSAMKGLSASVYATISYFYQDMFPGGQDLFFDASNEGVGLPMETSQFRTFSQADYDIIFARLAAGEFPRVVELGNGSPSILTVNIVNIIEVN